jgi:hypothetical protein
MALRIHFIDDLKGTPGEFDMWRVESGYTRVPDEVPDMFDRHFFDKDELAEPDPES